LRLRPTASGAVLFGFAAALLLLLGAPAGARGGDRAAQTVDAAQIVHLVDYVGADYEAALAAAAGGDTRELSEQAEVIAEAGRIAAKLPARGKTPRGYDVTAALARVGGLVRARAAQAEVASEVEAVHAHLVLDFELAEAPRAPPSRERGRALFEMHCATCHGADGKADTPRAREYTPRPANFHDPKVALDLSPLRIFNTIRFGVPNTAMAPFDFLPEASRWDLAFYAATLDHEPPADATGDARFFTLSDLSSRTDREIAEDLAAAGIPEHAVPRALDDLRTQAPFDPRIAGRAGHEASLLHARAGVARVRALFMRGEREEARQVLIATYLDDVEPVEAPLRAADPALLKKIEGHVNELRDLSSSSDDRERWSRTADELQGELARAARTLGFGGPEPSRWGVVLTSAGIALREGVEAALLIAALLGVVSQSGASDKRRWVHVGWMLAVAAGGATWLAVTRLVAHSGMGRETIEGLTALLAAAILFYVSYWLFARREAARWVGFLRGKAGDARAAVTIASIAFLAAYREAFETVVFYRALIAKEGAGLPALLGVVLGVALLAGLVFAYGRAGRFAPPRWFFGFSSLLLYVLAVIFAGQGIAALQTTGRLPRTPLPLPHLPVLGIYSTVETYVTQMFLIAMALLAAALLRRPTARSR
jgi:high-affinity iron transporter